MMKNLQVILFGFLLLTFTSCELDNIDTTQLVEDLSIWVGEEPNSEVQVDGARQGYFETHMRLQEGESDDGETHVMRLFAQNNDADKNTINVQFDFIEDEPVRENLSPGTYDFIELIDVSQTGFVAATFVWWHDPGGDEPGLTSTYLTDVQGQITITINNEDRLVGTYEFEARKMNSEDVVEVSNGKFDLSLPEDIIPFE